MEIPTTISARRVILVSTKLNVRAGQEISLSVDHIIINYKAKSVKDRVFSIVKYSI
jgi:hypothetical protein